MSQAFPERSLTELAKAYSIYTFEQNWLQAKYEKTGKYPFDTHAAADNAVYQNTAVMSDYMASLLLTQFLWPHHLEVVRFFRNRFVPLLDDKSQILEFAPGHGFYGRLALEQKPHAQLLGVDISPVSTALAAELAKVEGYADRARYQQGDVLLGGQFLPVCNAVVAGELLEHLDQPKLLIEAVARQLTPGGLAFVTGAITAANLDHVYEFKGPEEVIALLQGTPFTLVDSLLVAPQTLRPGTKRVPRVLAMILKR
jgi:SAM-dependent methyltransferase